MEARISGWNNHQWILRELELDPGVPLRLHQCRCCGRSFVVELRTGDQYAVHVGAMRLDRLSEEATSRWMAAVCPDERLESDQGDLKTRFLSYPAESGSSSVAIPNIPAVSPIFGRAANKRSKRVIQNQTRSLRPRAREGS
jgi:hypothetical protein